MSHEPYRSSGGPVSRATRVVRFALLRAVVRTVGRLSAGVRIGLKSGFDSGATLDYVCQNRACGFTPLGCWLDRVYLDNLGWRRIRERRQILQELLRQAVDSLLAAEQPVRILDIAAGPGRYILELAAARPGQVERVVLRDVEPESVRAARALADSLGLANVTCELGDAFDREAPATVRPPPTLAIVSGLYEQILDDGLVEASATAVARALAPGGLLIYTNQPWHPQLELIARVLTNRSGRPWVMRCRPQEDLDRLLAGAGFTKLSTHAVTDGILTVSLARLGTSRGEPLPAGPAGP